jgi:ubiquinone/menaquinone biosynthesis C-methylase UbiE
MRHTDSLPDYAPQIAAFHAAFGGELRDVVSTLPLAPEMQVLDVGCGDGFYTALLAERLQSPGGVTGLDVNEAYLEQARRRLASHEVRCRVEFRLGDLITLARGGEQFDFVWCAQNLFSLPEPVSALSQMAAAVRPGGIVAVLENDTLHQLLLPWPSHLEIALRTAELAAFADETSAPSKFYIGRRLPQVLAAAGLEPQFFRTQCLDRSGPLDGPLEEFLVHYLNRLSRRVAGRLKASVASDFAALIDPAAPTWLLRQPHFTLSWLNVLAWGRKPAPAGTAAGPGG